ncbi:T9SS C-terminal target domain-containing protein [Flavihumibacter petaseus]|uniref:PKD domain-containing protein n=1 Tax=Flavihumibacter petaseus NBRC 106054 TaxID=1220578 RepID=A0A0E9MXE1_9BACT|nr:T9SS C-terminal target domain-containing protein [Flavihumibacter petaseus]GAO41795.1 hypothetical protein FPE01S_01_08090 [Flavihumibacter petaseus NBRC 106054]
MKRFLLFCLLSLTGRICFAQPTVDGPYHINGNASKENCNCYTLTPNQNFMSGSVWNINKIDLRQSFDYKFEVYLGCSDASGADGMAFVLQPISTSVGSSGGGIGYEGITPSIGVVIDTWQNTENNDPSYDHISINRDGDIHHSSGNNLSGPVTALAGSENIEDCQWHALRVNWDAPSKKITVYMDGVERVSTVIDMVNDVFGGDPEVFWGFSSATGGSTNHQRFCTSLNAVFTQLPQQNYCAPAVVNFTDNSRSFGSILKWHWDFGDGSTVDVQNPPPHAYSTPGNYTVKSVILGNNGCWSDTFTQIITIGSIPQAAIDMPASICEDASYTPMDISTVAFGTINQWTWSIGSNTVTTQQVPEQTPAASGSIPVQLRVQTKEGCVSAPVAKQLTVLPRPTLTVSGPSAICSNETANLLATSTNPASDVSSWNWAPDGPSTAAFAFSTRTPADYNFSVTGTAANGCISDAMPWQVTVTGTQAYAGRDTVVADNQPVQLNGSGGPILQWSPPTGLDNPSSPNPVATIAHDMSYVLTASTSVGCFTKDTINIKVYKGPELYVPNSFTPNNDNRNDQFRFIAVGMREMKYFRIYNRLGQQVYNSLAKTGWDGTFSGQQQPSGVYTWMASGVDYNGKVYVKKGTLLLLR